MRLKTDIRPITHLKNRTADVVREVSSTRRPMIITQNGEARAVILDVETFEQLTRSVAMLKLVAQGERDHDRGQVEEQAVAFRRARAALRKARGDA